MEPSVTPPHSSAPPHAADPLRACVHCGLCLEECPTYKLTGDENNSPRGRLLLWRAESEGRLPPDSWTDFYTDECVGCLACASSCPANVPYEAILKQARSTRVAAGRTRVRWPVALAARAVRIPRLFNAALLPLRLLRRLDLRPHPLIFPGKPAVAQSTADYARIMMARHRPTGPMVAFLTGCLMEALFREINFATVRVLIENNVRVLVPAGQGCCGALHEHTGLPGHKELAAQNHAAFAGIQVDRVVSNSAGCGLALSQSLTGTPVQDVLGFLSEIGVKPRTRQPTNHRIFVDLPCHLVHGQRASISESILDACGVPWEYAPNAHDCCGSGGVYNLNKPANARAILAGKAAFLDQLPETVSPILATSNHVCMMQWQTARSFIRHPFEVRHVIQLLDPEAAW
ncbi:MAG: (Fe-S)-binding protein [Opitutaceae bacterium]|nr:(Fe-S)-binding protein [Opitutaceae bacterium]